MYVQGCCAFKQSGFHSRAIVFTQLNVNHLNKEGHYGNGVRFGCGEHHFSLSLCVT